MRDRTIDGFRAMAALGVVVAHAVDYRFARASFPGLHYLQRIADPLAQTSVQLFFVISGYIITTLLLGEEAKRGRISIPAFYIRRVCRIIPPLATLFLFILAARHFGMIELDNASLLSSATFTCNLGLVDCSWWVAHTWSLSVEEQFYLFWPMLLAFIPNRSVLLVVTIVSLLTLFAIAPLAVHSNFVSFACIGAGALYASHRPMRTAVTGVARGWAWLAAIVLLILGPLFVPAKPMQAAMPFLIVYVIFAGREIGFVRTPLAWKPVQLIGLSSYSLYLWQQVFLASPDLYRGVVLPICLLPLAVTASVLLIEQPFIRLGRRLSSAVLGEQKPVPVAECTVLPAP
jgi:peptidoglycan/LPS O-acetylase OafA/YrhL